ncbi:hypothetical protein BDV96DRAFT_163180 [Lophiotrema nucula]|uniref:Uncharacterized protein n=1 Tax=Lophiotrema nucula TaxID=690887 RepID=A0A6A5Z095_9PLEO|nr:hypothetical protein BDV96DRAFT_163180 [Lophiotrema nucula]
MSVREFDEGLSADDEPALYKRLYGLACKAKDAESSASLSIYAEQYLRSFCDNRGSDTRRRWIGVTFLRMIQAAPTVLQQLKLSLPRVGGILLRPEEAEDIKIVAGLIIRKALAHSIPWNSCWPSGKGPDNFVDFPRGEVDKWMQRYQEFLDSLAKLHPTSSAADPAILYAVALIASDGYKMSHSTHILVLIQNGAIICTTTNQSIQELDFVDIPLRNVKGIELKPATLYDSQSRGTKHEAYNVVFKLSANTWTYQVNTVDKAGAELAMLFATREDAQECMNCVQEAIAVSKAERNVGSSQTLNISEQEDEEDIRNVMRSTLPSEPPTTEAHGSSQKDAIHITSSVSDSSEDYMDDEAAHTPTTLDGVPQAMSERDASPALQQPASRPPETGMMKAKPIGPKPKVSAKSRFYVENTGDEEDALVALVPKTKLSSNAGRNSVNEEHVESPKPHQAAQKHSLGSVSKSSPRKPLQAATLSVQNVQQNVTSGAGPKPSTLPKVSKPSGPASRMKKTAVSGDIFDVPSDDESQKKLLRATRKSMRKVDYREVNDEHSESGSNVVQSSASPAPAKRGRPPRKAKPAAKPAVKKVKDPKARVSKASASQPIPSSKHSIVSKLAKSMPASVDTSKSTKLKPLVKKQPKAAKQSKSSSPEPTDPAVKPPTDDFDVVMSDDAHHEDTGEPPAQNTIAKAESVVANGSPKQTQKPTILPKQVLKDEHTPEPKLKSPTGKKRPASSSPPSTPNVKRMRTMPPTSSPSFRGDKMGIERPAMFSNQPKVLEDPSSPCDNTKRWGKITPSPRQSIGTLLISMNDVEEDGPVRAPDVWKTEKVLGSFAAAQLSPAKGYTPLGHQTERPHSGGSSSTEVLSSNSKPLPASPHAESMAVSGLADSGDVEMQKMIGDLVTARSDPFKGRAKAATSSFTRRLTEESTGNDDPQVLDISPVKAKDVLGSQKPSIYVKAAARVDRNSKVKLLPTQTCLAQPKYPSNVSSRPNPRSSQTSPSLRQVGGEAIPAFPAFTQDSAVNRQQQAIEARQNPVINEQQDLGMGEETTLVADDDELPVATNASPMYFRSSPPPGSPSSSHSSTSAELEPDEEPSSSIPTDQAEEMEWETALEPHQRSIHDELIRISKRVTRHVVGNETVISDIVETYDQDGKHLLERVVERNTSEFEGLFQEAGEKKKKMKYALSKMANNLKKRQNRLAA